MQKVHKEPEPELEPDPDKDVEFKGINLHHYRVMCDLEHGSIYIKVAGEYHLFYPNPVHTYNYEHGTDFLYSIRTRHASK